MEIATLIVGPFETNCYLVYDHSGGGVIIDPGAEAERIIAQCTRLAFVPEAILLTHGHVDHIGAVNQLAQHYRVPFFAGHGEEALLESAEANLSIPYGEAVTCPGYERLLDDGEEVRFGPLAFTVMATPGHSPGGICFHAGTVLFCGNTLFCGSIGRTDFPGCSHRRLIQSITDKLLVLPDETVCYPGHGPSTTIGEERGSNPFLTGGYFV